ncbi:RraA family protein [Alteribacillus sp. YIM 98480]|uniref:RraA family protein n=1 Tax=Alteribacillus sp. YIM 98480 TaxID=2606599 RepID=UPI00131A999E|nr:RraA family protein [Alteribacillus sp. YIM 98480]
MMVGALGYGYNKDFDRSHVEQIKYLENAEAAQVTDAQGRTGTMHPRIKPIQQQCKVLGPAITVDLPLGDNLMLYVALKIAKPGDVLVVSTNGNNTKAIWGELMTQSAAALKLGGLVVDGLIRDIEANKERDFPIFCCGSVPVSVEKNGPGFVNGEVSCGDVTVRPGDIVVGDGDGVVAVKKENLSHVIQKVEHLQKREEKRIAEITSGKVLPSWLDNKMEEIDKLHQKERVLE